MSPEPTLDSFKLPELGGDQTVELADMLEHVVEPGGAENS